MRTIETDVAIIGAGTAGMGAYRGAREHTERVLLIESGPYGTTCARVGCMPSKLLIAAAEAAHVVGSAGAFGVQVAGRTVDGEAVMRRVRSERDRFVGFVVETVESWPEAHRLRGHARFTAPGRLQAGDAEVRAGRVVIATGSHPVVPVQWREALGDRLIVNDDVFDWHTLPRSVAVVGAGVIGLELALALARLGVRVRLLGRRERVGPLSDPVVGAKARAIVAAALPFTPNAEHIHVARDGEDVRVECHADGELHVERFDYLLAAAGRAPNVHDLGLEHAGIDLGCGGIPKFDRFTGQCGASPVFIAGDVTAERPLLHEAADAGRIAGDNAGRYPDVRVRPRRAPLAIVFSEPQIMMAGESFAELNARKADIAIGEVGFDDQGRSRVMARNSGHLRVYGERHSGAFLGAEMIGPAAEHIGHLLAWSVQHRLTVQQMLDSPFYHPVVEEGLRSALRQLNRNLQMGPVPVERCLDCGPGA
jgi:dihydrolipoamide dehydrogenase